MLRRNAVKFAILPQMNKEIKIGNFLFRIFNSIDFIDFYHNGFRNDAEYPN